MSSLFANIYLPSFHHFLFLGSFLIKPSPWAAKQTATQVLLPTLTCPTHSPRFSLFLGPLFSPPCSKVPKQAAQVRLLAPLYLPYTLGRITTHGGQTFFILLAPPSAHHTRGITCVCRAEAAAVAPSFHFPLFRSGCWGRWWASFSSTSLSVCLSLLFVCFCLSIIQAHTQKTAAKLGYSRLVQ